MRGRIEEVPRGDGDSVIGKESLDESSRIIHPGEPWEHHRRLGRFDQLELRMREHKRARDLEVGGEQPSRPLSQSRELAERKRREPVGRRAAGVVDDVARTANALGDRRRCDRPPRSQIRRARTTSSGCCVTMNGPSRRAADRERRRDRRGPATPRRDTPRRPATCAPTRRGDSSRAPSSALASSDTPDGLCGVETTIRRVRGVTRLARSSTSIAKPLSNRRSNRSTCAPIRRQARSAGRSPAARSGRDRRRRRGGYGEEVCARAAAPR